MDSVEAEAWPDESGPLDAGLRYEHGKVVPHLTVAERIARGKAARRRGATFEPRGLRGWRDPPRPGGLARAPGNDASAGAGAAPLWPDAGLALHVLSRRGVDHGERLGQHATLRAHDTALRRCAPHELRCVRGARSSVGVRHERLRRNPAWAVGVGREAARGELCDRRTRQRLLGEGPQRACC